MGLTTLNLVDAGLSAHKDLNLFWKIMEERTELVHKSLRLRFDKLKDVTSDASPIHWQHGAIARLDKHAPIRPILESPVSTISMGYIGMYECIMALIGKSNTTPEGEKLALDIIKFLRKKIDQWKEEDGLGYALYGTPSESLTDRVARLAKKKFGVIPGITDRLFVTNSFHIFVEEPIDAFSKLKYEAQFAKYSSGGFISYVEVPNMSKNIDAIIKLMQFMYENTQYGEFNTKLDYCQVCNYEGEIICDDNLQWVCPNCGNRDTDKMNIVRRT